MILVTWPRRRCRSWRCSRSPNAKAATNLRLVTEGVGGAISATQHASNRGQIRLIGVEALPTAGSSAGGTVPGRGAYGAGGAGSVVADCAGNYGN